MNQSDKDNRAERVRCAVLGATGMVGQVFAWLLSRHPWFDPVLLMASEKHAGKSLGRGAKWRLPVQIPDALRHRQITRLDPDRLVQSGVKVVFSALPNELARRTEPELRDAGCAVFTNASALRGNPGVPIVIPEINAAALEPVVERVAGGKGAMVSNPNCAVSGLALALAPLRVFGIRKVTVATYQSLSGAGYPGLPSLDVAGNVIPFISREEEKMSYELRTILGIDTEVSATCVRVPVPFGHLESVWVEFERTAAEEDIMDAWRSFAPVALPEPLPSLPANPVLYRRERDEPQPSQAFWGEPPGMPVFTGRLRVHNNTAAFILLVNNLVRGAAGGSIANAEVITARVEEKLCR